MRMPVAGIPARKRELCLVPRGEDMLRLVYLLAFLTVFVWSTPAFCAQKDQETYSHALASYQNGLYSTARDGFKAMLAEHPDSSLAPNALYWLGETYYSENNYAEAILAFRLVPSRFPSHNKAAAALLKMGFAYEKLGDPRNAVHYLSAVNASYPDSSPAGLARTRLAQLIR